MTIMIPQLCKKGPIFWRPSRQRNGTKTTQKLRDLNTEILSSTLPRPDQAFERPQRPTESLTTPTFMPEVKARGARGGRQSDEVSK